MSDESGIPNAEEAELNQVRHSFNKQLDRHGFSFQQAVISKAIELSNTSKSMFRFVASEFPVAVRGAGTRIDAMFERITRMEQPLFLLAECKRANPALSNWCFVRAPFIHSKRMYSYGDSDPILFESVEKAGSPRLTQAWASPNYRVRHSYNIGIEVRSQAVGDKQGDGGQAIEKAASQSMRGLNGYVETLASNDELLKQNSGVTLMPVIFTTANLFATDADISKADLDTGKIEIERQGFTRAPWLSYQYHQTPDLKHEVSPSTKSSDLGALMDMEFIRTIIIVSTSGIEDYFYWASYLDIRR
jgi:hypothetical protein